MFFMHELGQFDKSGVIGRVGIVQKQAVQSFSLGDKFSCHHGKQFTDKSPRIFAISFCRIIHFLGLTQTIMKLRQG